MLIDSSGLEVLNREPCLALLCTTGIGRVGVSVGALPAVMPVAFALRDESIVIRAGRGTALAGACDQRVVAFEADGYRASTGQVWSVMARGVAQLVDADRYDGDAVIDRLPGWGPGPLNTVIAIPTSVVTGQRSPGYVAEGRSDTDWAALSLVH